MASISENSRPANFPSLVEILRIPLVVERRRKGTYQRLFRVNSGSESFVPNIATAMYAGGVALLLVAVFNKWPARFAEPAGELGTAMAVVGLVAVNVHRTDKRRRWFWYITACVFGALGSAAVMSGMVKDEHWISVISHLAVGALAFVLLENFFVSAFTQARDWSRAARQEFVVILGRRVTIELRDLPRETSSQNVTAI
jgi:hypothetical protein